MPFTMRVGFLNEGGQKQFVGKFLGRLPGCRVVEDANTPESQEDAASWMGLSISSPTMAREFSHQIQAFTNAHKGGVLLEWQGSDGTPQTFQFTGQQRDADILGARLATAVKAHNDSEKAK